MRAGEVAKIFRVDPKTPARWTKKNQIKAVLTPGGHHMFKRSDIRALVGDEVLEGRDRLMCPDEVASLFQVDPKTPVRWAAEGKIGSLRTPSNHHRFRESEVMSYLETHQAERKVYE
jgi:excisionase family DNA binding protein